MAIFGSAGSSSVFYLGLICRRAFEEKWLFTGRMSCHPTNSVKTLNET